MDWVYRELEFGVTGVWMVWNDLISRFQNAVDTKRR
jgi:hypothetical protein